MLVYLLLIIVLLWIIIDLWKKRYVIKLSKLPLTDTQCIPILGHALHFAGNNEHIMRVIEKEGRKCNKMGGVTSLWMANKLYVVVSDPEVADVVSKNCLEKDDAQLSVRFYIGYGSFVAPVPIWRPRRKLFAPTFSLTNLNTFVSVFAQRSTAMVDQLQTAADNGPVAFWRHLLHYTLASLCETILNIEVERNSTMVDIFMPELEAGLSYVGLRFLKPWLWNDALFKLSPLYQKMKPNRDAIHRIVDEIIREKRRDMTQMDPINGPSSNSNSSTKRKSILELLMEEFGKNGCAASDLELREETLVLMIAGIDTSAVGQGYTILMLAQYPEEQEKVYQELKEIFGSSNRLVTPDDIPRMKYLERFLKESLRLLPPAPITTRKVEKNINLPSGATLLKGCGVVLHNWAINRNPQYWGADAEQFRPSRFLEPMRHPAQFMAFSCGPRNCLGYQYAMMSMKTGIATLLRRYRVLPADATCAQPQLRLKFDVMMKDIDNYTVRIEPRN